MNRKIIASLAISLDGYIADEDGSYSWIKGDGDKSHDTTNQIDFADFVENVDTIVMGKSSFIDCGVESRKNFKTQKFYVATSNHLKTDLNNVERISGDICKQILDLKEKPGKNIWLFGGGILIDSFIKTNIIDEFHIAIIPMILGQGKRLFHENNPSIELHLEEYSVKDGIVMMKYTKNEKINEFENETNFTK